MYGMFSYAAAGLYKCYGYNLSTKTVIANDAGSINDAMVTITPGSNQYGWVTITAKKAITCSLWTYSGAYSPSAPFVYKSFAAGQQVANTAMQRGVFVIHSVDE